MDQLVDLKRFADEIPRAALDRFDRVFHRSISCDDNRHNFGIALDRGVDDGGAVDSRKAQVGDDDVKCELGQARQGHFTGARLLDVIPTISQLFRDRLTQSSLVFDEKKMFNGVRHLVSRQYFDTRRVRPARGEQFVPAFP